MLGLVLINGLDILLFFNRAKMAGVRKWSEEDDEIGNWESGMKMNGSRNRRGEKRRSVFLFFFIFK